VKSLLMMSAAALLSEAILFHLSKEKTKKQAPLIAEVSYGPKLTQKQQILHADLMYIKGIAFFVGVLAPLGLVMCVHLVSRTESSIYKAIKRILATGRAEDSPIHHST